MRTILDQGFYPDGIYTAPTEAALIRDIRLSMNMGFNGARLHQKVFEPRFCTGRTKWVTWCGVRPATGVQPQPAIGRGKLCGRMDADCGTDYNHPSIIGWCR